MECAAIKALMSEYLDDALDAQTKEAIERHVVTCAACEEELAALRAVIAELGSLRPMAAPDDFLARLHDRLERGSTLARIKRTLFSPFQIKLPLELVGVAAVAVLVFAVLNLQQTPREMVPRKDINVPPRVAESVRKEPPEQAFTRDTRMAAPAVPETPSGPAPVGDKVVAGRPMMKSAAPALADKNALTASREQKREWPSHPAGSFIELAVLIGPKDGETLDRREPATDEYAEREGSRVAEERALTPASEGVSPLKGGAVWEGTDPDALLASVKKLIQDVAGGVIAVSYDERTRQLRHITAQIPTSNYSVLAERLSRLATLQRPPSELPDQDAETIRVLITFLYPE